MRVEAEEEAQEEVLPVDCWVIPANEADDIEPMLVDEEIQEVAEEHEQNL
jgi:hypothetical protein